MLCRPVQLWRSGLEKKYTHVWAHTYINTWKLFGLRVAAANAWKLFRFCVAAAAKLLH